MKQYNSHLALHAGAHYENIRKYSLLT